MHTIVAIAQLEEVLTNNGISAQQAFSLLTTALPIAATSDPQEPLPPPLRALQVASDRLRQQQVGDTVTYVINRNINFTNICEQHCAFCAFRRDATAGDAYWLDIETILSKVADAVAQGATEICMQGGLNPAAKEGGSSLRYYQCLVREIKTAFPQIHLHAFSPQEIQFIAREDGRSYAQVIAALHEVGVDSMPGTAAEVLVDAVRSKICPEKINTATWLEIVETAHRLGVWTTSTMLCGHIETPADQVAHLQHLQQLQQKALEHNYPARITEFILLPYVGELAPKAMRQWVGRHQPQLLPTLVLTAVARLFLGQWIANHQPSWVKLGLRGATMALNWGCNDLGGTLMEEHITSVAGAQGGMGVSPGELVAAIHSLGRTPRQRTTLYNPVGERQ
ncbi:7,8-didemethyl-8-hydroxy-5-deazariboflavin synthase subunit 2 CofH [Thermosynechococcus sp. NK55a]|uniref:7,8-didemethyl-8-hydroxy-5-deazariboflavin synthase subunit CofH n=1 Tax=unclassified Thermosynechococcus TaxID=2622553 RepID=UPI0003D8A651|nr:MULTISPECIES: 7,8-didemethyl-8-hydroxy-5-deazariboflavin synthase subunit CofH [unclassified Thermosynechococcus]AHB88270.1 7,8-didemethyl-8-hydroxy-5-deazariboflavin synthase subunit 2 CofH [Thermosynechococcus sp. NK55a]HIK24140.1 7,8-didemethyl-8-hydroxy-5-deazariboflavin synthase subunit CofH [Thermosynechococcus sp. M3746_W2019_013]